MKRVLPLLFSIVILLAAGLSVSATAGPTVTSRKAATPMPQTTIRQQIVDKTILRLSRIRRSNGFQTDIGLALASSADRDNADSPPGMSEAQLSQHGRFGVFDSDNDQDQAGWDEGLSPNTLSLQALWFHPADWNARNLRIAIGDMKQALIEDETTGERDATFGGLLIGIKPVSDGFVRPQNTYQVDACGVSFAAHFLTPPFSDYL